MGGSAGSASSFGALLRRHRTVAGLTQEELAERSGLSVRAISDLERGRTSRPYRGSVASLARALGLDDATLAELVRAARAKATGMTFVRPDAPRQLPAALPHFAGRAAEAGVLDRLLEETAGVVMISAIGGMAGVGKTALAVHWAHRVADRFPDGQLYVNLRGFDPSASPIAPELAIRGFLGAFGIPTERIPTEVDAAASLYRSTLAGKRSLIVLDNARDAAQVRPLLPGGPGCLVLVTSRSTLGGLVADGARLLSLDVLTADESRDVLARRLGPERVTAEPDAVAELIAVCDRLPLALAVVAARAAMRPQFSLASLATELRDARSRLAALDAGDPAASVPAVFSWSFHQLSPAAARLFGLLGVHPGPDVSVVAAASLAGVSRGDARGLVAELRDAHLLMEQLPGRFGLHDLLRAYANELAEADPERDQATRRMLDHYLHTACAADRLANQWWQAPIIVAPPDAGVTVEDLPDRPAAMDWLTAEEQVLLACVNVAAEHGFDAYAVQLAYALRDFLFLAGYWHDLVSVQLTALAAAERLGDRVGLAAAHRAAGAAYTRLDRADEALMHLRAAIDLLGQLGDPAGKARALLTVGDVLNRQGDHRAAALSAHEALELFQQAGDRLGQARAVNNVGWSHGLLGEYEKELHYCQLALALNREINDTAGEAYTLDSLGHAHHHLGNLTEAVTCYRRAIECSRDSGDYQCVADALDRLGDVYWALADADAARGAWSQAAAIMDDVHYAGVAKVRAKLERAAPTEGH